MMRWRRWRPRLTWGLTSILWSAAAVCASAQGLPTEPVSIAGGRLVVSGEITATVGSADPGFFNYVNYEFSALRNFRIGMMTEARATDRVRFLADVRLDHGNVLEPYGLFARVRVLQRHALDVEAGLVPRTFGAMAGVAYATSNILIGQPLAYQYLLSLRPDAIPRTVDDLLRMRGRGWLSSFPVGERNAAPGRPLINISTPDAGVRVHGVQGPVEWAGAITAGALSDPHVRDNNAGRQFTGRIVVRPSPGVVLGASAGRGAWLDRALGAATENQALAAAGQMVTGGDAEYSSGPVLVRGEVIRSAWALPIAALDQPLVAISGRVEGRYRLWPGLSLAARGERMDFSRVRAATGLEPWEAAVWRVEAGTTWSITRNLVASASWQRNERRGGRVRRDTLVAAQVLYWF